MTDPNATAKPLIVQGADTVLLEVMSPAFGEARARLMAFAELVKAPQHVHTYRVTALSVWNARASGVSLEEMLETLHRYSRYPVPESFEKEIRTHASRYGRLRLVRRDDALTLESSDPDTLAEAAVDRDVQKWLGPRRDPLHYHIDPERRGLLKLALLKAGFPPTDEAGYSDGDRLAFEFREQTLAGGAFELRDYQREAAAGFADPRFAAGGSGVVVLPCGAGKTIVGLACMHALQTTTLVLCTSVTAAKQWIAEALDKTTLEPDEVGLYHGPGRELRPVTVATYQMLTYRRSRDEPMLNLEVFDRANWGLIVYDEVHLLPAPVFQVTAALQARRRLGLTATLVREDGKEDEVFALIGPKKVDVPWRELEEQGWIATAVCSEIRVPLPVWQRLDYARAPKRQRFRIASENIQKIPLVRALVEAHPGQPVLIMAMYLEQVKELGSALGLPFLTGDSSQAKRDELFAALEAGELAGLVVSKIGNFSVDLPEVSVAIQVSGTFGSRQEEAQRLGRILRPKRDRRQASFYSLVSSGTVEEDFALNRHRFLCEQGYEYRISYAEPGSAAGAVANEWAGRSQTETQTGAEPLEPAPSL